MRKRKASHIVAVVCSIITQRRLCKKQAIVSLEPAIMNMCNKLICNNLNSDSFHFWEGFFVFLGSILHVFLTWQTGQRSRGRNACPQLQGQQEDWKLQNSAKILATWVVHGCIGRLLPSMQPHILAVVFRADRISQTQDCCFSSQISPSSTLFCFGIVPQLLVFTSLNMCFFVPCLSFALGQVVSSIPVRTAMWMTCPLDRNWFSIFSSGVTAQDYPSPHSTSFSQGSACIFPVFSATSI